MISTNPFAVCTFVRPLLWLSTLALFLLSIPIQADAQTSFWDSPNAFLGQTPPDEKPVKFAPGMLADTGITMDRLAFSLDGKEFYYGYAARWFSTQDRQVRVLKYRDGRWNGPTVLNKDHFYAPTFSVDGKTLYFLGDKGEVWKSDRKGDDWTTPVPYLKMRYGVYDFVPTISGTMYVASNGLKGDIKDWNGYDFSVLTIAGKDTTIRSLGIPLNTPGFDGDFYIARDESFIIVSAKETKDFECELYISFRKKDKTWTNPKSISPLVNNGIAHRWGQYVTPNNKYLFYTQGHNEKDCHFYWMRFDRLLEQLRKSNFEPYVKKPIEKQATTVGKAFSLKVPQETFMDDDGVHTLVYTATQDDDSALPEWLRFDATKRTFSGKPVKAGNYRIKLSATDTEHTVASNVFELEVK